MSEAGRTDFQATRRMGRRAAISRAGCAVLALATVACRPAPSPVPTLAPPTPSPTTAARIRLGAVVDLGVEDRSAGQGRWQGAVLGTEMVNAEGGVPVPGAARTALELVTYQTDGRASEVAAAMERLARADGALAIVADGSVAAGEAVRREAGSLAMPTIVLDERRVGPVNPAGWTYALGVSEVDAATALVQFLAANGTQGVGWIAPRTATAEAVRDALVGEATRSTLRVIAEEGYPAGGEPTPDALARLAFAGAQILVGWPGSVAEGVALVRLAAERARGVALYLGPVAATPMFLSRAGDAAGGVRAIVPRLAVPDYLWDNDPLTTPTRRFLGAFQQRFGATPSLAAATAWDAVRIVAAAIERSGPDRARVRDAIGRTEAFAGASGPIDFAGGRPNGLDGRAFIVARAERGAWVLPP